VTHKTSIIAERIANNKYYAYMKAGTHFYAHYGAYPFKYSSEREKKFGGQKL
jgi:hypothetical protein